MFRHLCGQLTDVRPQAPWTEYYGMPYGSSVWHDYINAKDVYGFHALMNKVMWDTYRNVKMCGLTAYLEIKVGGGNRFGVEDVSKEMEDQVKSKCALQSTMSHTCHTHVGYQNVYTGLCTSDVHSLIGELVRTLRNLFNREPRASGVPGTEL